MSEQHQCSERVAHYGGGRLPIYSNCEHRGKVERDGKWYCGQHDPVRRKERQAERSREREEKWAASNERRRRSHAYLAAVAGIPTAAVAGIPTAAVAGIPTAAVAGAIAELIRAARTMANKCEWSDQIRIPLTAEQKRLIAEAAELNALEMTAWARMVLILAAQAQRGGVTSASDQQSLSSPNDNMS